MGDIKLFRIGKDEISELKGHSVALEKSLQTLIEKNLETFFGIRFLASEHSTGKTHGGRIDTLGIDENSCPVIIEYKRALNENVINQGLFYLDWLLDHKAEFEMFVLKRFGQKEAGEIDWYNPRLVCIAGDYTTYDQHAVQQINRNIELVRYRHYGDDFLLFELVNSSTIQESEGADGQGVRKGKVEYKTTSELLAQSSDDLRDRFEALKASLLALGDDVQMKTLKYYFAFKRMKNFACVEVHPQSKKLLVYLKLNPDTIHLEGGFSRDVRKIGHFGTGDLELTIGSSDDLEKAGPLIIKSYESA
jgi:predicted transport protein